MRSPTKSIRHQRVNQCEACGRVVAAVFPMHVCVPDGEERFSIARYEHHEEEASRTAPAEARGLTKTQAAIWLRRHTDDPSEWAVTRWEPDYDDPFGGAMPTGSVDGGLFVHDNDAHGARD